MTAQYESPKVIENVITMENISMALSYLSKRMIKPPKRGIAIIGTIGVIHLIEGKLPDNR